MLEPEAVIEWNGVVELVSILLDDGFQVVGPTNRNGAISFAPVRSANELASGFHDEHAPGVYRLSEDESQPPFRYMPGPSSLKTFLRAPVLKLFEIQSDARELRIVPRVAD